MRDKKGCTAVATRRSPGACATAGIYPYIGRLIKFAVFLKNASAVIGTEYNSQPCPTAEVSISESALVMSRGVISLGGQCWGDDI